MQNHTPTNRTSLSLASQQANAERGGTVTPYSRDAVEKLASLDQAIQEAKASVNRLSIHSQPEQREALQKVHLGLNNALETNQVAQSELGKSAPEKDATLAKNGQSQFNAAARGDQRSMEAQIPPVIRERIVPISASRGDGRETRLDQIRGDAVKAFENTSDGKQPEAKESTKVNSEQVRNSKPEPQLRPSPELAGGVDATAHLHAKSQDARRASEARQSIEEIAAGLHQKTGDGKDMSMSQNMDQAQGIGR